MSAFVKYLEPRSETMKDVRITVPNTDTLRLAQGDNVIDVHADDIDQLIWILQAAIRVAYQEQEYAKSETPTERDLAKYDYDRDLALRVRDRQIGSGMKHR